MWLLFWGVSYELLYYIKLHKWKFADMRVKLNLYKEICVFFFSLLLGNDKPRMTLNSHLSSHHWPESLTTNRYRGLCVYEFSAQGLLFGIPKVHAVLSQHSGELSFPAFFCVTEFFFHLLLCRNAVLSES